VDEGPCSRPGPLVRSGGGDDKERRLFAAADRLDRHIDDEICGGDVGEDLFDISPNGRLKRTSDSSATRSEYGSEPGVSTRPVMVREHCGSRFRPVAADSPMREGQSAVCSYSPLALGPGGQTTVAGIPVRGVELTSMVRPPMTFGSQNFGVDRCLKNPKWAIASLASDGLVVWHLDGVPPGSPGQMTGTSTWRPNSASIVPMTSPSVAYEFTASMRAGIRLTSGSAASARTRSNDASTVAWSRS
jgi:hypothetical protein